METFLLIFVGIPALILVASLIFRILVEIFFSRPVQSKIFSWKLDRTIRRNTARAQSEDSEARNRVEGNANLRTKAQITSSQLIYRFSKQFPSYPAVVTKRNRKIKSELEKMEINLYLRITPDGLALYFPDDSYDGYGPDTSRPLIVLKFAEIGFKELRDKSIRNGVLVCCAQSLAAHCSKWSDCSCSCEPGFSTYEQASYTDKCLVLTCPNPDYNKSLIDW